MRARDERGDGKLGTVMGLVFLGAFIYAASNLIPIFKAHYELVDKVNDIARSSRSFNDERIKAMIWEEVQAQRLDDYLAKDSFKVATTPRGRRINAEYEVPIKLLPGFVKTFQFEIASDQPVI